MRLPAAFSSLVGTSAGVEGSQAPFDFSSPLFSNQAVQGTLQTKSGPQVPSGAKHGPLSCLSSAPGIDSPDLLLTLQPCAVLDTKNLLIIRS